LQRPQPLRKIAAAMIEERMSGTITMPPAFTISNMV